MKPSPATHRTSRDEQLGRPPRWKDQFAKVQRQQNRPPVEELARHYEAMGVVSGRRVRGGGRGE